MKFLNKCSFYFVKLNLISYKSIRKMFMMITHVHTFLSELQHSYKICRTISLQVTISNFRFKCAVCIIQYIIQANDFISIVKYWLVQKSKSENPLKYGTLCHGENYFYHFLFQKIYKFLFNKTQSE